MTTMSIIKNMTNKTTIVNPSKHSKLNKIMEPLLTSGQCLKQELKKQLDIDIGYAIGLLKKEDQNVNVYVCIVLFHYYYSI